ncbi:hypothetical protein [Streptomyces sp. NBC_00690]|uniref:hypothetical protein n=1 Tax=Streptomyces sp. NBC_00690 TaxID=2975808 RepID=UPI002E2BBB8A|nr:hypothetical protein [Streptomyces sp. NBC_00690]
MSRETDSSSSGPQGRGGAAYPSGTPPYGSRQYPPLHPTQDAPDGAATDAADRARDPRSDAAAAQSVATSKPEPKTETTLTTRIRINIPGSRPIPPVVMRKPMSEAEAPAKAPARPAVEQDAERTAAMPAIGGPQAPTAPAGPTGAPTGQPAEKPPSSDWFAPRKSGTNGAGIPSPATEERTGAPVPAVPGQQGGSKGSLSELAAGAGTAASARQQPTGATAGPAQGNMPVRPRSDGGPKAGVPGASAPAGHLAALPGQQTAAGYGAPGAAVPRMSDDTAVLTPQKPIPEQGGRPAPRSQVSGDTLTSGIPVVPAADTAGGTGPHGRRPGGDFAPADFPAGPAAARPSAPDAAAAPAPASRPAPPRPAKKGRSKLVLMGVGVVGLLGIAYGAGLLLNHSEVPKETTVLGVDIGGGTKEQAVVKLDAALGKRAATALQLTIGDKKEQLAPDKAGLSLDSQTTVRQAAGSDYNPISVIGSLFGEQRVAEPVIVVDEEKLSVALTDLAGNSGSAVEGTIKFEPNKVTAVPGKPGNGLDVARSMTSVKDAFRAQVETGRPNVVQLPVVSREPTVSEAEIQRALKEFAEPAMSDRITINAGGQTIPFGPAKSLPRILSMKAVDGKLVEFYDKKAIEELIGSTFAGVMITKGDGQKHQLSADDVAQAMGPALRGKTRAERTVEISLNPN